MKKRRANPRRFSISPRLEELEWFLATVKYGNAAQASKALKIDNTTTIPDGNRRIIKTVGVKLLNQDNTLTEAGEVFVKYAIRVLAAHRKMLREIKKVEAAERANPKIVLHVENWMLDAVNFAEILPNYEIRHLIRYDEPAELWQKAALPKKRDAFVIGNFSVYESLESKYNHKPEIINYRLRLYGSDPVDTYPIRGIDINSFGFIDPQQLLPEGIPMVKVAEVANPVELRHAILGGAGVGCLPTLHWSDGLVDIFPQGKYQPVKIWLMTNVG